MASHDAGLRPRFGERGRGVGSPPLMGIWWTERLSVTSGSRDWTSRRDTGARARARRDGGGCTGWDLKWIDGTADETGWATGVEGAMSVTGGAVGRTRRRGDEGGDGLVQMLDARGSVRTTSSVAGRGN